MAPSTRIRFMLPFTVKVINPITRRFVGFVPRFSMLTHVGRKSGRSPHTPINVFRRGDHYVCARTYGSDDQWLKYSLAAGSVVMRTRGRYIRLVDPELIVDPNRRLMPL